MYNWYEIEKLNDKVYAIIDNDGGWFLSNTGLVDMGSYTLVIDTQYNEKRANDVLNIINDLRLPKPGLIINTHHHGDHTWGNHVINKPAIMHKEANKMVNILKENSLNIYKQFFPQLDFKGSEYTLPDIVIGDEGVILETKQGLINVKYLGPSHTTGDIIVIVDWADVIFAGDIIFNQVTPLAIDGTILNWINVLDKLEEISNGKIIVGGHGKIADEKTIRLMKEYFLHIANRTKESISNGISDPLIISKNIGPGPLKGWRLEERIVFNVERALLDFQGKPPGELITNLPELAIKMIKYSAPNK
ncbi:MAG: MBL fold metallo-hydrolase [Caldisphaera sp.]